MWPPLHLRRLHELAVRITEPNADDLPNRRVVFGFPVVLLVILAVLVGLGITGSSTGILNQFFSNSADPALLAGRPEGIRSDEWNVQTPLVISQVEQGLPLMNRGFPGGTDSTVQSDLPSRDWSMIFRPHLDGFLFLPLDNAMALRWWLPAFTMMAAVYLFFVTLNPRRPVTATLVAVGFFVQPFFQWWYLPITFWPVSWSFLVMTAAVWCLRSRSWRPKLILLALIAYLTVSVAIGVYVPFMIPALLVAVAFVLGLLFTRRPTQPDLRLGGRLRRLLPLAASGAAGTVIVGIWAFTRWDTIERFLGTVYPGQRLTPPGSATLHQDLSLLAAPFTRNLGIAGTPPLDQNPSEASSFFLIGLFLLVPLLWMGWRAWRTGDGIDVVPIALTVLLFVMIAFLVIPGWDALSHLLLLDRTTAARLRPGFGILSVVVMSVYTDHIDRRRSSGSLGAFSIGIVGLLLCGGATIAVGFILHYNEVPLVTETFTWIPIAVLFVISTGLTAGGWVASGSAILLVAATLTAGGVNPIYVGVYDLNGTRLMRVIKDLPSALSVKWVGVGTILPTAVLQQSGLHTYSGFQSAPSPLMWEQIDPTKMYESQWNRLANIRWIDGAGSPRPQAPQTDVILINFDSCSTFAKKHVGYVLSDAPLGSKCASLVDTVQQGPRKFWIYSER